METKDSIMSKHSIDLTAMEEPKPFDNWLVDAVLSPHGFETYAISYSPQTDEGWKRLSIVLRNNHMGDIWIKEIRSRGRPLFTYATLSNGSGHLHNVGIGQLDLKPGLHVLFAPPGYGKTRVLTQTQNDWLDTKQYTKPKQLFYSQVAEPSNMYVEFGANETAIESDWFIWDWELNVLVTRMGATQYQAALLASAAVMGETVAFDSASSMIFQSTGSLSTGGVNQSALSPFTELSAALTMTGGHLLMTVNPLAKATKEDADETIEDLKVDKFVRALGGVSESITVIDYRNESTPKVWHKSRAVTKRQWIDTKIGLEHTAAPRQGIESVQCWNDNLPKIVGRSSMPTPRSPHNPETEGPALLTGRPAEGHLVGGRQVTDFDYESVDSSDVHE